MSAHYEKVLRDPVYGNLTIPWPVLLELVDSPEFQRLRNVRQLGMCFTTFHGAEHSRFQHALGVMWLMYRVLDLWQKNGLADMALEERQAACAAALLHDLGHGPFSHALERVFSGVDHEVLGRQIVRSRLAPILSRHGVDPETVAAIMEGTYHRPVFHELLASQLDVDRMDYLQRDSLYTGVKYGLFDIERILHTLVPMHDDTLYLAVDYKGTQAVEEFLFSRYFMHWQVYLHRTVRSAELLLRVVLERAQEVFAEDRDKLRVPANLLFLFERETISPERFLEGFLGMDDFDFFNAIKLWKQANDPLLADLATRLSERRLFKVLRHPGKAEKLERIQALVEAEFGADWRYYLREDRPGETAFGVYHPGSGTPIRVLIRPPNQWKEITEVTRTDAILALGQKSGGGFLMVAPECREGAFAVLHPSMEEVTRRS